MMISEHFSPLTNPSPERQRPAFDVPDRPATRYAVVTDKEAYGDPGPRSASCHRRGTRARSAAIARSCATSCSPRCSSDRLDELGQSANPPFIDAAADRCLFPAPRTHDEAVLQALVANDGVQRGLDALVTELQRVVRFGFTADELDRAKQATHAGYERVVTESPDRESASRADEYTRNFLQGEALPTIWQELAFHRRFLPGITLAEMNALRPTGSRAEPAGVVIAPEARARLPDQRSLPLWSRRSAKPLDPTPTRPPVRRSWTPPPTRGSVVEYRAPRRPVLRSGRFERCDRRAQADRAQGGSDPVPRGGARRTSLASDADFAAARVADDVIRAGGVGKFNGLTLDKLLTGKAVRVRPFIGEISQGWPAAPRRRISRRCSSSLPALHRSRAPMPTLLRR